MKLKVLTKKKWHKLKDALQKEREDNYNNYQEALARLQQHFNDELAGILFQLLARDPGQTHCTFEIDKSALKMATLVRSTLSDGKQYYKVHLKSLEP